MRCRAVLFPLLTCVTLACNGSDDQGNSFGSGETAPTTGDTDPTTAGTDTGDTQNDSSDSTAGDGPLLDVGSPDTDGGNPACKVPEGELDAVPCRAQPAPPDSFNPVTQWDWMGPNGETESLSIALVGNLTDDNDDGEVDLCDDPDIVVTAFASGYPGHIYVLDGNSGEVHYRIETDVEDTVTPALGDVDDDGIPEIVALTPEGALIAFNHDGSTEWTGAPSMLAGLSSTLQLADIDADGDVEIITGRFVADHVGTMLWEAGPTVFAWAPTAVDLDEDGMMEVLYGTATYTHDGTLLWTFPGILPGFPQVGDLDDDGLPEILYTDFDGVSVIEDNGQIKELNLTPTGAPTDATAWVRPAAIHDFDGDGVSEFAMSSESTFSVMELDPMGGITVSWSTPVLDTSGVAGGTGFDFLGDGVAEAMYADETTFFVFDGMDGNVELSGPRSSRTLYEYPVVADVDNDGSAEIVVVSNDGFEGQPSPTLQVIRDADDRWIQARRIWNQHTYHVTNVREDGTIPQFETPHWKDLNTFRINAQIEGGTICVPPG